MLASLWLRRSVVRPWLLELTACDLEGNRDLAGIDAYVDAPGKDAGRCRKQLNAGSRSLPSPGHCVPVFVRAATTPSAIGCWPRGDSNSAVTP